MNHNEIITVKPSILWLFGHFKRLIKTIAPLKSLQIKFCKKTQNGDIYQIRDKLTERNGCKLCTRKCKNENVVDDFFVRKFETWDVNYMHF